MNSSSSSTQKNNSENSNQSGMDLMQPGPEHAQLAKMVGTWKVTYTHWLKEGAEPIKATGKAIFTSIFDGRFIREEFTGEFQGKPFIGIGTMGFDRAAQRFVNTWYDNMGTGIVMTTGVSSADGKDLVTRGRMTCPMKGEMDLRHVYAHHSDDHVTLTMYNKVDGKESKGMEIIYTRES